MLGECTVFEWLRLGYVWAPMSIAATDCRNRELLLVPYSHLQRFGFARPFHETRYPGRRPAFPSMSTAPVYVGPSTLMLFFNSSCLFILACGFVASLTLSIKLDLRRIVSGPVLQRFQAEGVFDSWGSCGTCSTCGIWGSCGACGSGRSGRAGRSGRGFALGTVIVENLWD